MRTISRFSLCLALAAAVLAPNVLLFAADTPNEQDLISVLTGDKPKGDKAIACKKLAIFGSDKAIPALEPLLCDPELASWARIAIEAIPGQAADQALRNTIPKVQGRLLVGTLNSIGVRRDAKAIPALAAKLKDGDPTVASAAAVSLGKIGGPKAASALKTALTKVPAEVRGAVAEGCVRCAEQYLAAGSDSKAASLYDAVRNADVPKQKQLDATRGAILARKAKGIPLLVEQLRSPDKAFLAIGLSTARELPGPEATKAVITELHSAAPERQPLLLFALSDRNDAAVLPAVIDCVGSQSKPLQLTAIRILDKIGNESCIAVLEKAAGSSDNDCSQAAVTTLTRLQGSGVDAQLVNDLDRASGKTRCALIDVAGRRSIQSALPAIGRSATDADPAVRGAAVQALGAMGTSKQIPELSRLLRNTREEKDRTGIHEALLAICSRGGAACVPDIQSLAQDADSRVRVTSLALLAASGGPDALNAVKSATNDKDESVQDEAVRTLSSWPNTWPEDEAVTEPLLTVAKSGAKPSHQVLALRGYLQFLEGDKKLKQEDKLAKVGEIVPLLQRPEEKRLAITVVRSVGSPEAVTLLGNFAQDQTVADDAFSAALDLATARRSSLSKEQKQQALQMITEKCANEDLKKRAGEALNKLK